MIHEVSEALRALVRRALEGSEVEVVLEAPTRDWAARRSAPTVSLYLYDIHEDVSRRRAGEVIERGPDDDTGTRRRPPRFFRLSYLLTAWTSRPEDEHRLLAAALTTLVTNPVLPQDSLPESVTGLGVPVPVTVAQPAETDRPVTDVWSALGGELKASLDVAVIAPLDSARRIPLGPLVQEPLVLGEGEGAPTWRPLGEGTG